MQEYSLSTEDVLKSVGSSTLGLSDEVAERRLSLAGKNQLAEKKKKNFILRFLEELSDPMIVILIVAAVVSGITSWYAGENFVDVFIILFVVVVNAVLGVVQESKAERAIESLKRIAADTCTVIRGKAKKIRTENLVVGDVVLLEAGDSVPADCRILSCSSFRVEEAALTGESKAVLKTSQRISKAAELGDRKNMVYFGSTVSHGNAKAVVVATGMHTEIGKIATTLNKVSEGDTPLQKRLNELSKLLSLIVLGICAVIFAVNLLRADSITVSTTIDTFMVAVSLAVAAIPEGLSAVFTIVLSIGVTNMSKHGAIIRKLTAVETLGCTSVICSDKTGTLTQNRMTVVETYGECKEMLLCMALCNDVNGDMGDPTEIALVNYAKYHGYEKTNDKSLSSVIPFDSERKMMTTVHGSMSFTKGAPDVVLSKCSTAFVNGEEIPLTSSIKNRMLSKNEQMAGKALRVLGFAVGHASPEKDMCFIGLAGMIDPVREGVRDAIVQCKSAGIKTVMITGDHLATAVAIGKELGINGEAVTGAQLDELSDKQLSERIENISIYARVRPEHKSRIVNAWQTKGNVVAMTGDGVNDATSVKSADIGIAMGDGADVVKNVADMVLANNDFSTIVTAAKEGRRIYENVKKAIQFLIASNLSEVVTIFVSMLFGFNILEPAHLLWINLITDCFPALALGMEKAEDDIMERLPRSPGEGIFADGMVIDIAIEGIIVAALTVAAYIYGANIGVGTTMAFLTLSMTEIFHSFNMRSRTKSIFHLDHNPYIWASATASVCCACAVIYIPFLSEVFGFVNLQALDFAFAMSLSLLIIPIVELSKLIKNSIRKQLRLKAKAIF